MSHNSCSIDMEWPLQQTQQQDDHASSEDLVILDLRIPTEVLEMILCQVSIKHLFFSCKLVCKRWNDIVMWEKVGSWFLGLHYHINDLGFYSLEEEGDDCLHSIGEGWGSLTCALDITKWANHSWMNRSSHHQSSWDDTASSLYGSIRWCVSLSSIFKYTL